MVPGEEALARFCAFATLAKEFPERPSDHASLEAIAGGLP